jgi:hypothetical protein
MKRIGSGGPPGPVSGQTRRLKAGYAVTGDDPSLNAQKVHWISGRF